MASHADDSRKRVTALAVAALAAGGLVALHFERKRARRAARGAARIAELRIHPLKSGGACLVDEAEVTRYGFRYDRAFAVVDENTPNREIQTQRKLPQLATIKTQLTKTALVLSAPGMDDLSLPLDTTGLEVCTAQKIGSVVVDLNCHRYGEEASKWLQVVLREGRKGSKQGIVPSFCLVQLDPTRAVPENGAGEFRARRVREQLAGEVAGEWDSCAIHDWCAFYMASMESLRDLNSRLSSQGSNIVGIDRFRANIVLDGGELRPYEEDRWAVVRLGAARFRCLQGCPKCTMPMVDQDTGRRPDGQNPVLALGKYRMFTEDVAGPYAARGPYFGTWAAPEGLQEGDTHETVVVRVGDLLTVEQTAAVSPYDHWARAHPEARPGRG